MTTDITELHVPCEECGSSDARVVYTDGHSYCFSCTNYISGKKDFDSLSFTYEHLPWRGITKETMAKYDVKTKIDESGKPVSIGFQYPDGSYKVRYLDRKEFYTTGGKGNGGLFGRDKFEPGSHKYVTITEGELDALSLAQVLKSPVASVHSSSTAARDCAVDRSWLNSYERIYLAFDNDAAGIEAAAKVARLFDFNKVYHVKFNTHKDANEYVKLGESEELRNLWWNSKRYLPETIKSSFSDFDAILREKHNEGVPYPFPTLNEMTYGIRTGETVLITAMEGVGKTELMHAIEYQLLKRTQDNVGAIFLEEPKRRHLQAIAGLELQKPAHLPDGGCSDDEVSAALQKAIGVDDRLHIYSHFGCDDPEVIIDTIRYLVSACACRYILFDHITMAVSGSSDKDERTALDYIATRLEMMVQELDFALIIVSHVNDFGQTRGSRYISKLAHIRIDLSRDLVTGSNITDLVVSKNRFCGRTGPAGSLVFNANTYTLSEGEQNATWPADNSNDQGLVLHAAA